MLKFLFRHGSIAWFGGELSFSEHGRRLPYSVLNVGCRGNGGGRGVRWRMLIFKARDRTA